jgi:hypothetical protein
LKYWIPQGTGDRDLGMGKKGWQDKALSFLEHRFRIPGNSISGEKFNETWASGRRNPISVTAF